MAIITIISAAASAFVVLVVYYAIINPGFVSPLAKIPAAHWSCHYAPLWILAVRWNRRENSTLLEAHRRLGPVVRIGPKDVSIDGIDGLRVIYQGGFEKDPGIACSAIMASTTCSRPSPLALTPSASEPCQTYTPSPSFTPLVPPRPRQPPSCRTGCCRCCAQSRHLRVPASTCFPFFSPAPWTSLQPTSLTSPAGQTLCAAPMNAIRGWRCISPAPSTAFGRRSCRS